MFDGSTTVETGSADVSGGRAAWRELGMVSIREYLERRMGVDTFHVESPHEDLSEVATFQTDAVLALKTLGFKKDAAARAVREAIECDAPGDLEALLKAALRRCGT